jgi:hypothetical protein
MFWFGGWRDKNLGTWGYGKLLLIVLLVGIALIVIVSLIAGR